MGSEMCIRDRLFKVEGNRVEIREQSNIAAGEVATYRDDWRIVSKLPLLFWHNKHKHGDCHLTDAEKAQLEQEVQALIDEDNDEQGVRKKSTCSLI